MEIIAHRGASHAAPENTLAAAQLAWAENADALELDVRLTADAQLVVVHDENTRRVADRAIIVSRSDLAKLQGLDVGRWKDVRYAGEKIPTLQEILVSVPDRKRVFIEVKGGVEVVPVLARCLGLQKIAPTQVVVISFDFAVVVAAKKALPHCAAAWILDDDPKPPLLSLDGIIDRCHKNGLDALDLGATWPIDDAVVSQIHRAGLKLFVWTVDDPLLARRLANAGVDGITTNRPGWLREQLA